MALGLGLDENEKGYLCSSDNDVSDDGLSGTECLFGDSKFGDDLESGESYSDYTYETAWDEEGSETWDEKTKDAKDDDGNDITDYQNIYIACDFDTGKEALDTVKADCGKPKVLKTKHSEDPDKKCFAHILNGLVSAVLLIVGF